MRCGSSTRRPRRGGATGAYRMCGPRRACGTRGRGAVELVAEAEGRQVPVRVLEPSSGQPRGVFLEIHGGGFYMGWAARSDARNRRLADALGIAVVSVDYRLPPEHPWPAAPDDCENAALWLLKESEARFGTSQLAIGGGSGGG